MLNLTELAERLENSPGPDRELDWAIIQAKFPGAKLPQAGFYHGLFDHGGGHFRLRDFRYTASLDAAMTLVPEGDADTMFSATIWAGKTPPNFGGSAARVFRYVRDEEAEGGWAIVADGTITRAATPALALCAASLRARSAMEKK